MDFRLFALMVLLLTFLPACRTMTEGGAAAKRETAGCVTHIHLGGFLLKDQPRQWHQGRSRHHGCLNGRSEWDPNNANATIQGDVD